MIKWSVLRDRIAKSVLRDTKLSKYGPEDTLVWARLACIQLSFHTADLARRVLVCNGTDYQFPLPEDMVDTIEDTGRVAWVGRGDIVYLNCLRQQPNQTWPLLSTADEVVPSGSGSDLAAVASISTTEATGFWEWPSGVLTLSFKPAKDDVLYIDYFRIWEPPQDDNSILKFPMWMEAPFMYLAGAAALDPQGVQASTIHQWDDETASGNPEHNPLMRQSDYFRAISTSLLRLHRPQNRETFYKESVTT